MSLGQGQADSTKPAHRLIYQSSLLIFIINHKFWQAKIHARKKDIWRNHLKNHPTYFYAKIPVLNSWGSFNLHNTHRLPSATPTFWELKILGSIFINDSMKNTNKKDHKYNKRGVEKQLLYFLELIVTSCKNMYYRKLSQLGLKLGLK